MKKSKIILIFIIVIILTGCKGEYNLSFNKDLSLSESINFLVENDEETYEKTLKLLEENEIDDSMYSVTQTEEFVNIKYQEEFNNFEDYLVNSKFYNAIFNNEDLKKDNRGISYRGMANLKLDDSNKSSNLNNSYDISNLKINLKIPFMVKENNADKIEGNTLVWELSKNDSSKIINFSFDYLKSNNLYMIIILLCVGIVLVSGFIIIRNYLKERKL